MAKEPRPRESWYRAAVSPATCRVCGKGFVSIGNRNKHERVSDCSRKTVPVPHTELLTSIEGDSVTIVTVEVTEEVKEGVVEGLVEGVKEGVMEESVVSIHCGGPLRPGFCHHCCFTFKSLVSRPQQMRQHLLQCLLAPKLTPHHTVVRMMEVAREEEFVRLQVGRTVLQVTPPQHLAPFCQGAAAVLHHGDRCAGVLAPVLSWEQGAGGGRRRRGRQATEDRPVRRGRLRRPPPGRRGGRRAPAPPPHRQPPRGRGAEHGRRPDQAQPGEAAEGAGGGGEGGHGGGEGEEEAGEESGAANQKPGKRQPGPGPCHRHQPRSVKWRVR